MSIARSELIRKWVRRSAIAPISESVRWRLLSPGANDHTVRSCGVDQEVLLVVFGCPHFGAAQHA